MEPCFSLCAAASDVQRHNLAARTQCPLNADYVVKLGQWPYCCRHSTLDCFRQKHLYVRSNQMMMMSGVEWVNNFLVCCCTFH